MARPPVLPVAPILVLAGCAAPAALPPAAFDPLPARAVIAEEAPAPTEPPRRARWEEENTIYWSLVPYAWKTDADGDITAGSFEASVDDPDRDVVLGGRMEAYMDRVALVLDGFYAHAGTTDAAGVEGDARYGRFDVSVALRILGDPPRPIGERGGLLHLTLDGIAGIRTNVAALNVDPPGFAIVDHDETWLEPMAGLRGDLRLFRRFHAFARADISGIAYDDRECVSYGGEVGVRVDLIDGLCAFAGLRYVRVQLDEDLDHDGFDETSIDFELNGPWAGLILEF